MLQALLIHELILKCPISLFLLDWFFWLQSKFPDSSTTNSTETYNPYFYIDTMVTLWKSHKFLKLVFILPSVEYYRIHDKHTRLFFSSSYLRTKLFCDTPGK